MEGEGREDKLTEESKGDDSASDKKEGVSDGKQDETVKEEAKETEVKDTTAAVSDDKNVENPPVSEVGETSTSEQPFESKEGVRSDGRKGTSEGHRGRSRKSHISPARKKVGKIREQPELKVGEILLAVKPEQANAKSKGRKTPRVSPSRETKGTQDQLKEDGSKDPEPGHEVPDIIVTFGKGDSEGYFIAHAVDDSKGFVKGYGKGDGKDGKKNEETGQKRSAVKSKDKSPVRGKTPKAVEEKKEKSPTRGTRLTADEIKTKSPVRGEQLKSAVQSKDTSPAREKPSKSANDKPSKKTKIRNVVDNIKDSDKQGKQNLFNK